VAEHLLFEAGGAVAGLELDPEDWTLHTSNETTQFVEGPPKIVVTVPEPDAIMTPAPGLVVEVVFHEDVVAAATEFTLAGDAQGDVPTTFAYDPATHTATLDPGVLLPPDVYTVRVDEGVVDVAAGIALDGEVASGALPSGDGLPGGDAVVRFTVTAAPGDLDGDGDVDFTDLLLFLSQWGACPAPPADCPADLDGSGFVDLADLLVLLGNWG
jgi:hypothetical protein